MCRASGRFFGACGDTGEGESAREERRVVSLARRNFSGGGAGALGELCGCIGGRRDTSGLLVALCEIQSCIERDLACEEVYDPRFMFEGRFAWAR